MKTIIQHFESALKKFEEAEDLDGVGKPRQAFEDLRQAVYVLFAKYSLEEIKKDLLRGASEDSICNILHKFNMLELDRSPAGSPVRCFYERAMNCYLNMMSPNFETKFKEIFGIDFPMNLVGNCMDGGPMSFRSDLFAHSLGMSIRDFVRKSLDLPGMGYSLSVSWSDDE